MADDNSVIVNPEKQEEIRNPSWWKPGQSGNPNGRPKKGTTLTDIMRQMFNENGNIPKAIVAKLLQMAADGDIAAIREVLDRIEGKAVQTTELTGQDGLPILISAARGYIPAGTPVTPASEGSDAGISGAVQGSGLAPESPKDNHGNL